MKTFGLKNLLFCLTLPILGLASCNNDDFPIENINDKKQIDSDLLKVAAFGEILSADEILDNVINIINTSPSRSSISTLTISDSLKVCVSDNSTRSTSTNDSVNLYCVYDQRLNISTLVCGNRLYPFSLAIIEGEFNAEKIEDYGISDFINLLPTYLSHNKIEYNTDEITDIESQLVSAEYSDGIYSFVVESEEEAEPFQRILYETDYSYSSVIDPLVKVQWGQRHPYNMTLDLVPNENGTSYILPPTGCVAVAICQILSAHKAPSSITVENFSWQGNWDALTLYPSANSLTEEYQTQIANLMKIVGKGVSMNYNWDGSGSNINNAYNFFTATLGFNADQISNFSYTSVRQSLLNNCPVYVRATDSSAGGHAWVLDGSRTETAKQYERIYRCKVDIPSNPIIESEWRLVSSRLLTETSTAQVHCNWGWNGYSDGYFNSGVFNVSGYSFTNNINTICNICPN